MTDSYARPNVDRDAEGYFFTVNLGGDLLRFRMTDGVFEMLCVRMRHLRASDTRNNAPAEVVTLAEARPHTLPRKDPQ